MNMGKAFNKGVREPRVTVTVLALTTLGDTTKT
jgi:hypothetical protein